MFIGKKCNFFSYYNSLAQFIWIKKCIELASFSVPINGELAGYFNSKRGLRQGCSFLPYLYVICMQVLTKLLDKAALENRIDYHPYCKELSITHLCFADDVLVFSDGKKSSIEGMLTVFKKFAMMSGLSISLEKSTMFLAGVKEDATVEILDQFPFEAGSLPVRYLGLPLLSKKMSITDYAPLISQIRNKISSWTARHLSFAGRLQLIGYVMYSVTNFWMSAFRLPKQCIREINSLCSAFLWSGPVMSTQKTKIAWSDVCKPKEEGGLGLRDLEEVNKVSCLKLIWRILSARSSLWVQWIHKYLIRKSSFWNVKETSSLGSWMWKKVLKLRPLALQLTKMEVNSGAWTSFWL
uniref:Reverse transcriptase domain-containing protein n=1 Tax=Brassica oleracea var. oleracea TaxID=109376 RepID=A0A0D3E306_BRAOL